MNHEPSSIDMGDIRGGLGHQVFGFPCASHPRRHGRPAGRGAWPSRSTIGRLAGCSVRTVSYALKNLEASGLISRGRPAHRLQPRRIQADRLEPQHGRGVQKLHPSKPPNKQCNMTAHHQCKQIAHHQCNEGCKNQRTGVQTAVQHVCTRTQLRKNRI